MLHSYATMVGARVLYVIALVLFVIAFVAVLWARARSVAGGARSVDGGARSVDGGARSVAGGAEKIEVIWPSPQNCFPRKAIADCLAAVRKIAGFAPVTLEEREKLSKIAATVGKTHGVAVKAHALISMRTMEAALAAQGAGVRAQRHGDKIMASYLRGTPVVKIAQQKNLPPVAVLRQILIELGHTPANIRKQLQNPSTLPEQLAKQIDDISAADLGSRTNADLIKKAADAFEERLGAHLQKLGVEFVTERETRKKSVESFPGPDILRTALTPDFLLARPMFINGHEVNWIDAKNYPMYGGRLVAKGLSRQAQKYTNAFGPGAFVFSGGVLCGARILPALPLLLDGSFI